jgi:hypothetical protein
MAKERMKYLLLHSAAPCSSLSSSSSSFVKNSPPSVIIEETGGPQFPNTMQSHTKLSSSSRIIFTGISKSKISTNLIKKYSQTNLKTLNQNHQTSKRRSFDWKHKIPFPSFPSYAVLKQQQQQQENCKSKKDHPKQNKQPNKTKPRAKHRQREVLLEKKLVKILWGM